MSKRYWPIVFALGLALACPVLAQGIQQPIGPEKTENELGINDQTDVETAPGAIPDIPQTEDQASGSNTKQDEPDDQSRDALRSWEWVLLGDSLAQSVMAWASVAAAVAAAIAAFLVILTLNQSRKSDERQMRAYVGLQQVSFVYQEQNGRFCVAFIGKNHGQTPAYNVRVRCGWYTEGEAPDTEPLDENESSRGTVFPDGEMHIAFNTDDARSSEFPDRFLTADQCKAIWDAGGGFWVNARLEYTDAFGKKRYTNSRYKFYRRGTLSGLSVTADGNDSN